MSTVTTVRITTSTDCSSSSTPTNANLPPSQTPPWDRLVQTSLHETITEEDAVIGATPQVSKLSATAARSASLADGTLQGQSKQLFIHEDRRTDTGTWTITGNFFHGDTLTLDLYGTSALLQWIGDKWRLIGGNAPVS